MGIYVPMLVVGIMNKYKKSRWEILKLYFNENITTIFKFCIDVLKNSSEFNTVFVDLY